MEKWRNTENEIFAAEIFHVGDCKSSMKQSLKYFFHTWTPQNVFHKLQISSSNLVTYSIGWNIRRVAKFTAIPYLKLTIY